MSMRHLNDLWQELRFERAIDFDLYVAKPGVVVDGGPGFFFRVGKNLCWALIRTTPIHEARHYHARADLGPGIETAARLHEEISIVGQVADGSYPARHVQKAIAGRHVNVHVPQAGH